MNTLQIIKERKTIRRYKLKPISNKFLQTIIEAGIWGPSVPSFLRIQPWKFISISNKDIKNKLVKLIQNRSQGSGTSINIFTRAAANIINNAPVAILVFKSRDFEKVRHKYKTVYGNFSKIIKTAELCAISASIQNMILVAHSLGIGSCWLDTPLFFKQDIQELVNAEEDLVAILTLGYPAEEGKRSPRKPLSEMVTYLR